MPKIDLTGPRRSRGDTTGCGRQDEDAPDVIDREAGFARLELVLARSPMPYLVNA